MTVVPNIHTVNVHSSWRRFDVCVCVCMCVLVICVRVFTVFLYCFVYVYLFFISLLFNFVSYVFL